MISFGEDFIASTTALISDVFSDISPLLFLIVGLLVGFFILERIIEIISGGVEKKL